MNAVLLSAHLALLLLATARVIRLVVVDDLGALLVREPVERWQNRMAARWWAGRTPEQIAQAEERRTVPARVRLLDMVGCPWCIGFWIGAAMIALWQGALVLAGGWEIAWTAVCGALALNYVVAHLMGALGDFDGDDDDDDEE